jgi:predicted dinucleotide-binding enzyme
MGLTLGHSTSAAEEIAKAVPGAEVVKAFNTVFAQVLAEGADFGNGRKVSVFVAADSERAKQAARAIAESIGFDVVDAGGLKNARYLEPLAGLNIYLGYSAGLGTAIAPTWIRKA